MKKFFILLFLVVSFFPISPSKIVMADNNYYRIISEKAYLYENASKQTILFTLPYTYYVKVLAVKNDLYQIEIYGDDSSPAFFGYTEKENLLSDGLEVSSPYPTEKITTCTSTILYSDIECQDKLNFIFPERKLTYFGTMTNSNEQTVYLIGYGEKIGYVKANDVYEFSLSNHPNPLTFLEKNEEEIITPTISENTSNEEEKDDNLLLKISIVCCLIIAGTIGLYIAVRKKERPTKIVNYYDENEYE